MCLNTRQVSLHRVFHIFQQMLQHQFLFMWRHSPDYESCFTCLITFCWLLAQATRVNITSYISAIYVKSLLTTMPGQHAPLVQDLTHPPCLSLGSYSAMSNNMVCCHSVCVSYLNDEHFTSHWKQVIFLKNKALEGSIYFNSFQNEKKNICRSLVKVPRETLFESSVSNPSASAMSAVRSRLLCMVTWALLRQLKSPHCTPRLILLLVRPIFEARGKKTWMLLVAQTSHSEELSHPSPLLPWPHCFTMLFLLWFPNHDPQELSAFIK